MTPERAAELINIEKACVLRQDTPNCKRDECGCQNCDLIQNTEDILEAYDMAIEATQRATITGSKLERISDSLTVRNSKI